MSAIANVESVIVSVPAEGNAFAEGNEETVLVKVTDEDGLYGIGECVATTGIPPGRWLIRSPSTSGVRASKTS